MKLCAQSGPPRLVLPSAAGAPGAFTLLEMCLVLSIIALMLGVSLPAIQSAFAEQAVRHDAHQLAMAVKTAMIDSAEQHRAYVIELTSTSLALHPAGKTGPTPDGDLAKSGATESSAGPDSYAADKFETPTKLLTVDPRHSEAWIDMPPTPWLFQPGDLCPASRVRLVRSNAWLEMSFNALTGNVEDETTYFP